MVKSVSKIAEIKSPLYLTWNMRLLGIVFTVFTLIVTIVPDLMRENPFLVYQLVLSIPFLAASSMIRMKQAAIDDPGRLDKYGHFTFLVGYASIINSIGIVLASAVSISAGVIFILANMIVAIMYSLILIAKCNESIWKRVRKDILFVVLLVAFGLLIIL